MILHLLAMMEEIFKEAVKRLMDYFVNGESSSKTIHVILKSNLIIRNSC